MNPCWEHFNHDADIGIRGVAPTLAQAFEQAAIAMTAVITDPKTVDARETIAVTCHACDHEMLLLEWINELIYLMATRVMIFSHYKVVIDDCVLTAVVSGEAVVREKHWPAVEIKGATLTELKVFKSADNNWVAQCVVDV
jgi:tRNA nucleotidyltransferase (CCA-adding enzyme)